MKFSFCVQQESGNMFDHTLQMSFCACVLQRNMLLAGLFIERADPYKPGLKKSQVVTHASSTEANTIPFGRWTGLEYSEQWSWFLGCRPLRDGRQRTPQSRS